MLRWEAMLWCVVLIIWEADSWMRRLWPAPFAVVVYLYSKNNATAQACDGIGDEHWPYDTGAVQQSLEHKRKGAYGHHKECWQGNAACVACAYGGDGLWQVTEYHSNACHITADSVESWLFHCFLFCNNGTGKRFFEVLDRRITL